MDLFFSQDFHFFGSPLKKWKVEVKSKVLLQKGGFWARAAFCPAYLGSATAWTVAPLTRDRGVFAAMRGERETRFRRTRGGGD